jgi:hypothetical protein
MELVKYNNNSISSVTALGSLSSGSMVLLATNTITSGVSSSSFTSNIDSTYDTYLFKFINLHFSANDNAFFVKFRDGGSNFDATKTTSFIFAQHKEDGSGGAVSYDTDRDLAQSTGGHFLHLTTLSDDDASNSGEMFLFNPSSTTFVKQFIARVQGMSGAPKTVDAFTAGYANVTAAIDGVEFSSSSGTIDSGVIKMYGLSKS